MEDIYLVSAELINFQSHEKTTVNFVNGFNILAGSSNGGKSTIIRGILWNVLNEPSGDDFVRKGQKEATVITHWSNGYSIKRTRNKGGSKNFYTLIKDGEVINEYTGFGTSVPPEIIEVHKIQPLASGVYFNYADQLESAFMVSSTPKVRAETIGNLEELGRIDEEITIINTDITFNKKERKRLDKEICDLEKEKEIISLRVKTRGQKMDALRILKNSIQEKNVIVIHVENHLERLKQISEELSQCQQDVNRAICIIEKWDENLPNKIETFKVVQQAAVRLIEIQGEFKEISFMNEHSLRQLDELSSFVNATSNTFQQLKQLNDRLVEIHEDKEKTSTSIAPRTAMIDFSSLDKDVEKFRFIFNELGKLRKISQDIKTNEAVVSETGETISQLLNQFVEALHKDNVCPTCSQDTNNLTTNDIEKIL